MEPARHLTYADHYRKSAYACFPQEHRNAGSSVASVFRVRQQSHGFVDPPVPEMVVAAAIEADMTFSWDDRDRAGVAIHLQHLEHRPAAILLMPHVVQ